MNTLFEGGWHIMSPYAIVLAEKASALAELAVIIVDFQLLEQKARSPSPTLAAQCTICASTVYQSYLTTEQNERCAQIYTSDSSRLYSVRCCDHRATHGLSPFPAAATSFPHQQPLWSTIMKQVSYTTILEIMAVAVLETHSLIITSALQTVLTVLLCP